MEITEVRIKLMDGVQDRLLGFCSITIDRAFVVRDLKIIKGTKGAFVAMPSRKLTDRCRSCGNKNQLRAIFCSNCGLELGHDRSIKAPDGRAKLYADIAHPINAECRDLIQQHVLRAYDDELVLAQSPEYVCRYDDFGENDLELEDSERWDEVLTAEERSTRPRRFDPAQPQSSSGPHAVNETARTEAPVMPDGFGEGVF